MREGVEFNINVEQHVYDRYCRTTVVNALAGEDEFRIHSVRTLLFRVRPPLLDDFLFVPKQQDEAVDLVIGLRYVELVKVEYLLESYARVYTEFVH